MLSRGEERPRSREEELDLVRREEAGGPWAGRAGVGTVREMALGGYCDCPRASPPMISPAR